MDSKKLEILMTAVDLGSFSKASEVVGYTQSGLTHLVDSLEREIGLRLVRRDRSGVSLTREGEALMPSIREFLRENAKLENQIAAITEKKSETIRVAAYASIAMHWMRGSTPFCSKTARASRSNRPYGIRNSLSVNSSIGNSSPVSG